MNPKVSIIMPIYNEEEFLEKSLDSFFSQTLYSECELICIDDGSTDGSLSILNVYKEKYPENMVMLSQSNQGSGKARNVGIDKARGQYIGFLDADDLYPSESVLQIMFEAAECHDVSIAGGEMIIFNGEVESSDFATVRGFEGYCFNESGVIEYSDYQFDYGYQRFIYKRSLLLENNIYFPPYLRYQDPPFFVRAMIAADRFFALAEPTYRYRTEAKMITWTVPKLADMLSGIVEVASLAAQHGLVSLFSTNLMRFDVDWRPVFRQLIIDEHKIEVLRLVYDASNAILSLGGKLGLEVQLVESPTVQQDIVNTFTQLSEREDQIIQLNKEKDALNDELVQKRSELQDMQLKYDELIIQHDNEIEAIQASTIWKIGSAVTWIPRTFKDGMNSR
ncbi:MAG: glycosyltransferase [Raoultibacter sp.]